MADKEIVIRFNVKLKGCTTVLKEGFEPGVVGWQEVKFKQPARMSDTAFAAALLDYQQQAIDEMIEVDMVEVK